MDHTSAKVRERTVLRVGALFAFGAAASVLGCSSDGSTQSPSNGGSVSHGGAGSGGASTGTGGTAAGGAPSFGGQASGGQLGSGGAAQGGKSGVGGSDNGGASSGGRTGGMGGQASGGQASGGKSSSGGSAGAGGAATGGSSATGGKSSSGGSSSGGAQASGGSGGAGGSGGGSATQSAGCGKAPTIPSSQYNNGQTISITAANMQRRYILNVPTNYDNTKPYRLVIAYHARDGNDKQLYSWQYYGLLPLSNNTTIFVAPNGQKNGAPCSSTASGDSSCGWPNTNDSDLALADAIVAQIEDNFCIDKTRIFATGWSYGGSMSYRTACSRSQGGSASWYVRGIAIYSAAQLSGNCTPSKPAAFYASHGTHDSVLDYEMMGLPLAQNYAKANGCTWATPTKVTSGAHVCTNLMGCSSGYPLEFCSFNGDHTPFPDNGQSQGSWGPQEAWKFLSQF